jgi:Alcohol dehydrogenase GroES-like domain
MDGRRMKAAVIAAANARWELRDRDVPEPGPHQVLVRIHACGICGTDLWMAQGKLSYRPFPLVLGHEGWVRSSLSGTASPSSSPATGSGCRWSRRGAASANSAAGGTPAASSPRRTAPPPF